MLKTNADIRATAKTSGVYLWQIAEQLGINDSTFSRKLRKELSTEEKATIYGIIARISSKESENNG